MQLCATYQPPISLSGLYCRGDNSTGALERFHYTASRGIISSDISLAVPAGLKFRASDPPSASSPVPLLSGEPQPLSKRWRKLSTCADIATITENGRFCRSNDMFRVSVGTFYSIFDLQGTWKFQENQVEPVSFV